MKSVSFLTAQIYFSIKTYLASKRLGAAMFLSVMRIANGTPKHRAILHNESLFQMHQAWIKYINA